MDEEHQQNNKRLGDAEDGLFEDIDESEGDALLRIKKLKEELRKCTAERKEYLDGWQRVKADYLNSKKRFEEEGRAMRLAGERALIEDILPLCDSFDMALTGEGEESVWKVGLTQIAGQLRTLLARYDVTEIEAEGKPFNPHEHEALQNQVVADPTLHDTVVLVLQKGYRHKDTLLRPAKVIIGTYNS